MNLRKLEIKDAPLMLEWMHDPSVVCYLKGDFSSKTIQDAEAFISKSWEDPNNINLAIVSDTDEYMGTVSLKNIEAGGAEFAISIRKKAMNHGYSWFGMKEIIDEAFSKYGLRYVYWCVSNNNSRAIRFYDKHCFKESHNIPQKALERYAGENGLKWYMVRKEDALDKRETIAGCRIVRIRTVRSQIDGSLSFFEGNREIPFDIKRIYYIFGVPEGVRRGFHAHKQLKQFLFCPYGRIQLILENRYGREEIELSDPTVGILIEKLTWREMLWIQKDSVLCVAASDYYSEEDYIRDYEEFRREIGG